MAQCPQCKNQVEIGSEYFGGLFTCPQCKAVYFISFDGAPETNETPAVSYEVASPNPETEMPAYAPMEPLVPYEMEPIVQEQSLDVPNFNPLQDVVDFANSETNMGLATFNLTIRGLELGPNIQALKEVFTDTKLGLNWEEFRSKVKKGEIRFEKLNPSQAAILAFRLRPLPLEMLWEQEIQ